MRKVIKEYDVYKFEELEKEVQEKLIEKYMEYEYEWYADNELYDDMAELAKDSLQNYFKGAEYQEIYYDLSYSQGSGAMVEFNIDLKDLNNKYRMLSDENIKKCSDIGYTNIKISHNNSHYYHERTFDIDWNDYTDNDNFEEIQNAIDSMIEIFKDDIILMNRKIARDGYNMLEDRLMFEEMAMKHINELEFLKNGDEF